MQEKQRGVVEESAKFGLGFDFKMCGNKSKWRCLQAATCRGWCETQSEILMSSASSLPDGKTKPPLEKLKMTIEHEALRKTDNTMGLTTK